MSDEKLSNSCLIASACVLLAGDILQLLNPGGIGWTILLAISFLLFIAGLPYVTALLLITPAAFRRAILFCLLIGAVAGASMQALFRAVGILNEAGERRAGDILMANPSISLSTMVPGIFFPLGLLLLSVALFMQKRWSLWKVVLLMAGAILFPVGHAVGIPAPLLAGDVLLIASWVLLSGADRKISGQA